MARPHRKDAELLRFRIFRERTGLPPGGEPTQPDPPEPDLSVASESGLIGIEMTELVANRRERAQESEQDGVISAAQRLYEQNGLPCLAANFYWRDAVTIQKRGRRDLAAYLARLVETHVPRLSEQVIPDPTHEATEFFEHPLFDRIWLDRLIDYDENHWFCPRSWWVGQLMPESVQARIDAKNSRPSAYRGRYAQRWLIITSDGGSPSSGFDLAPAVLEHTYRSNFDRVFLALFAKGGIRELRLHAGSRSRPNPRQQRAGAWSSCTCVAGECY